MRLFQNYGIHYPPYISRLQTLRKGFSTYDEMVSVFLADRYGSSHFLTPILERHPEAFFANGDDETAQRIWAREQGMAHDAGLAEILLAQIEAHRTEVFYNVDPMRYGSDFVRRLPGCVKKSICWRAAPSPGADFEAYDLVVSNFPSILKRYTNEGWSTAYFLPGHDPVLDEYARNTDRPIDVLFVGTYSRHHMRRARILERVAALGKNYRIVFALECSRATRLAESVAGRLLPLGRFRRPKAVRAVTREAAYGLELYHLLSQSKIVLNGAGEIAGDERGNMRCWEALGARALMVSDSGKYPPGMNNGETIIEFSDEADAANKVVAAIEQRERSETIANAGFELIRTKYGKAEQWELFKKLI